jgi:pimeloyl-ACP methyl ester carboxylesterase
MSEILLVHGAWHGPWCWDEFSQALVQRGHEVRAVQLRGHDQRSGRIWYRLRDYVEDVETAVEQFDERPVIVGHSMGGMVVQRYLEHHPAPGAVLMASIPVGGGLAAAGRLAVRHPLAMAKTNLTWSLRPFIAAHSLVRALFFTPTTPREVVEGCAARLQDESYPAFLGLLLALRRRRRARTPMLVLAAGQDGILTLGEQRRTARAYGTEAEVFPTMGHDMMLEPGWPEVADRVDAWLRYEPVTSRANASNASR